MSEDVIFVEAKEIKPGKYIVINGIPCRVVEVDVSKPGKHGAAKMRIVGIGIFNGQKKTLLTPSDAEVQVPIIKKKTGQVLSISGEYAQVMDKDTYEVFDVYIPEELRGQVEEGKEVELLEAMGQRAMIRIFKG